MRRLAATLLCATMLAPPALAAPSALEIFLQIPWTLGVKLSEWVNKESRRVFYVEVIAEGSDLEQARQQAFRMAVERAVGVVVASETEVQDQRIQRDEIITYASGYIDEFESVDVRRIGDRTWVKMRVWVGTSRIRDRLLSRSRSDGRVEGGRISEQIRSFQNERQSADRLLVTVLNDYPQRAYEIQTHRTEVRVDDHRNTYLVVPFTVKWSQPYLRSLEEVLKNINQRSDCGGWLDVCRPAPRSLIRLGKTTAYFDDSVAYDLVHQHMIIDHSEFLVTLFDTGGRRVYSRCFAAPEIDHRSYSPWRFIDLGNMEVQVNVGATKVYDAMIQIKDIRIDDIDRAKITVIRHRKC